MISYLALIQMIKAQPENGAFFYNVAGSDVYDKLQRFKSMGCIELKTGYDHNLRYGLRATITQKEQPTPVIERVQVSFWRGGARKDKHAGQVFEVLERFTYNDHEFIRYQMTPDKVHTVKAEYTKAAA